jgi:hypothetical protein
LINSFNSTAQELVLESSLMVLRAPSELVALQGEEGALPDKLFHNNSKLLDANT